MTKEFVRMWNKKSSHSSVCMDFSWMKSYPSVVFHLYTPHNWQWIQHCMWGIFRNLVSLEIPKRMDQGSQYEDPKFEYSHRVNRLHLCILKPIFYFDPFIVLNSWFTMTIPNTTVYLPQLFDFAVMHVKHCLEVAGASNQLSIICVFRSLYF